MHIFNVSPLAVLIVAVIQWLLGAIWYGFVFKARWKALVGIPEGRSSNAWFPMVAAFVANIVLAFVLAVLIGQNVLVVTNFEKRPAKLFAINAAYWLLAMMLGGGVMANLHI